MPIVYTSDDSTRTATSVRRRPTHSRSCYRTCRRREFIRALQRGGFYSARSGGSHDVFVHSELGGSIPVPKHEKDTANGTLAKILRSVKSVTGEELAV